MQDSNSEEAAGITNLETLNEYLSNLDNSVSNSYISKIPDVCKEYPCCLGIDEAGRGPVLGPMVYGTSFCPINEAELLATLNCADSKTLNEQKRDDIFGEICKNSNKIGWGVEVISANKICNSMLSRSKYSLNQVSMDAAIGLIRAAISAGVNIEYIFVDTVGPPEKYQSYLHSIFPKYKITVAKKADSTYPIVSAASICAKVVRDHALQTWKFHEGLNLNYKDFGSGYPGDPVTKSFLANNCDMVFGFPQLVRFSWSTASKILEEEAYHVEWEEVDEKEETDKPAVKNTAITSFFKVSKPKVERSVHNFFSHRGLSRNVEF